MSWTARSNCVVLVIVMLLAAQCSSTTEARVDEPLDETVEAPPASEESREETVQPSLVPNGPLTELLSVASVPDGPIEHVAVTDHVEAFKAAFGESTEICDLMDSGDEMVKLREPMHGYGSGFSLDYFAASDGHEQLADSFGFFPCEIEASLGSGVFVDPVPGTFTFQNPILSVAVTDDDVIGAASTDPVWSPRLVTRPEGNYTVLDWGDELDLSSRSVVRTVGQAGQLAISDGVVVRTAESELLERLLDTDRPRMIDRPFVADVVAELEREGAYAIVLSERLPAWPGDTPNPRQPLPDGVVGFEPWQLIVAAGVPHDGPSRAVLIIAYPTHDEAFVNSNHVVNFMVHAAERDTDEGVVSIASQLKLVNLGSRSFSSGALVEATFESVSGRPPLAILNGAILHRDPFLGASAAD